MNTSKNQKKSLPLYLITLIAIAAYALVAFIGSLIADAKIDGAGTAFEKLLYIIGDKMETPKIFGTWHIVSIIITLAVTVFLVAKFKDCSDAALRRILLVIWLTMVFFEVYKQLISYFDRNTWTWEYLWHAFPFQFCSTPLYLLPIIIFAKEGRVRNAVMAYMVTFSLFAGFIVMVYPGDVLCATIGLNIQTMVHHGLQLATGIFLVSHNRHKLSKRFFVWSMIVFVIFASLALLLNTVMYITHPEIVFNMFFISPYFPCTLPVLSAIYPLVPYPVYLLMYVLGFALVSALVYTIEKCTVTICSRIKHRGEN